MESPVFPDIPDDTRLIETFGFHPGVGFVRLEAHLARMAHSARALGVRFDAAAARALVQDQAGDQALRCRLTLGLAADLELTTAALGVTRGPWTLALASARLTASDPWLRHKTTNRAPYDHARAALPDGVDEVIFLNERGELCEGTITNLFVRLPGGRQVTPPLSSGVLPGVLRAELLASGGWSDQVLRVTDLRDAEAIWVGNSLRGLIRGRFHDVGGAEVY